MDKRSVHLLDQDDLKPRRLDAGAVLLGCGISMTCIGGVPRYAECSSPICVALSWRTATQRVALRMALSWRWPRHVLHASWCVTSSPTIVWSPTGRLHDGVMAGKSLRGTLSLGEGSPDSGDVLQRLVSVTNCIRFYFATPSFSCRYTVIPL